MIGTRGSPLADLLGRSSRATVTVMLLGVFLLEWTNPHGGPFGSFAPIIERTVRRVKSHMDHIKAVLLRGCTCFVCIPRITLCHKLSWRSSLLVDWRRDKGVSRGSEATGYERGHASGRGKSQRFLMEVNSRGHFARLGLRKPRGRSLRGPVMRSVLND